MNRHNNPRYCYWSVCDGWYANLMERCVQSARQVGIFKQFHVFTDRVVPGCECYDAQSVKETNGWFKLIYLKLGMSKMLFDYYVWIDADSLFIRPLDNILTCVRASPVHVPLLSNLSALETSGSTMPVPLQGYVATMRRAGVSNPVYLASTAFWIIHRDAIERVCELADYFRTVSAQLGLASTASDAISYAMQMLCANPEAHHVKNQPEIWGSGEVDVRENSMRGAPFLVLKDDFSGQTYQLRPSIVHLGRRRIAAEPGNCENTIEWMLRNEQNPKGKENTYALASI